MLAAALALAIAVLAANPGRRADVDVDFTWEHLAWAENLSPEHGFVGFSRLWSDSAGVAYEPYNRFPPLGHLLIKLVTLPFPDDAAARLGAARALMLGCFAGAAALAWLALRRLTDDWVALAAVLLAFSSLHALHYADLVSTEAALALFAVMLAFHGAAVFAARGRHGQLVAKVCAGLLLAWQVFALVGPLALLGLGAALWRRDWRSARRHFALGAAAVLFGAGVLGVNLAREHVALGGTTPLAEFPSVGSALIKLGIAPKYLIDWPRFATRQSHRLMLTSAPYAISHPAVGSARPEIEWERPGSAAAGGLLLLTTLALAAGVKTGRGRSARLTLAALALAGPCWILLMRHQAGHVHESLFHAGVPLAFFALALAGINPSRTPSLRARSRAGVGAAAAAAALAFATSVALTAWHRDGERARKEQALAADIDAIRGLVAGRTVLAATKYGYGADDFGLLLHFLHGGRATADPRLAEVVLRRGALGLGDSLTPANNVYFLYTRDAWKAAHRRYERLASEPPAAAGADYEAHLVDAPGGDELLIVRRDCPFAAGLPFGRHTVKRRRTEPVEVLWQEPARFFAHIHPRYPRDREALPAARQPHGFDNLPFPRGQWVWRAGGDCFTVRALPDYPIAAITVGQFRRRPAGDPLFENIWQATLAPAWASRGDRSP